MKPARFALPVLGLVVSACGSSGGEGGASGGGPPAVRVLEEGTGDPSTAPLWPLADGGVWDALRTEGVRDIGGQRVVVVAKVGEPDALNWLSPTYYSESEEGVLLHGSLRDGRSGRPVLVVPKQVRHGMRWESDPGDGGPSGAARPFRCSAQVTAGDTALTFVPGGRVWIVDCHDGYLFDWHQTLIEGVGPAPGRFFERRAAPTAAPTTESPATPLEPLLGGEPLLKDFFAHRVGAIVPADAPGTLRLVLEGEVADFSLGGVVDPSGGGIPVTSYLPAKTRACVLLSDGTTVDQELDVDQDCPDPLGAAIGGDGKLRSIPIGQFCLGGADACSPYHFLAIRGDARGAEVLVGSGPFYDARYYDGTAEHPWYRIEEASSVGATLGGLALLDRNGYSLWFGEAGSAGESLVVTDELGSVLHSGKWTGRWEEPHPAFLPAALSATVTKAGRDVLDVTPEGVVSRIVVESGDLRLALVARVALPAGHFAVGAVDTGDGLLVFTRAGYLGYRPQVIPAPPGTDTPPTIDPDIPPAFGHVYAWLAHPAGGPGAPEAPPAERTPTYVQAESRDVRVCTAEPWSGASTGFSVGGLPAARVEQLDDHCALVIRDAAGVPPASPTGPAVEPLALEGELPGIGQVRVGARPMEPDSTWPRLDSSGELAPLAGGGFVNGTSPLLLWAPGGVVENVVTGAEGAIPHADSTGHGMWMELPETADCAAATGCRKYALWGATRKDFSTQDPAPATVTQPVLPSTSGVVGGGLLTTRLLIRPDGSHRFYDLPPAPLGAQFTPGGALADGTVCGQYTEFVVVNGTSGQTQTTLCVEPGGTTRSGATPVWPPYHATPDGAFYALDSTNGTVRLDGATLAVTPVTFAGVPGLPTAGTSAVPTFVHDSKGELFAVFTPPQGTTSALPILVHLTGTGVEPVTLPTPAEQGFSSVRVVIDESAYLFLGAAGGGTGVLRVAR